MDSSNVSNATAIAAVSYTAGTAAVNIAQKLPKAKDEAAGTGTVEESKDELHNELQRAQDVEKQSPHASAQFKTQIRKDIVKATERDAAETGRIQANQQGGLSGLAHKAVDVAEGVLMGDSVEAKNTSLTQKLLSDEERALESNKVNDRTSSV